MKALTSENDLSFEDTVRGLMAGDFSRLAPLFESLPDGLPCPIIKWFDEGRFAGEPPALDEAFTCACFNGCDAVVEYLLVRGVNAAGGDHTGLNAFHWAANRGQLSTVRILIRNNAALESLNSYGGTVLDCTVWSAIHEPKPDHLRIIQALLDAGANAGAVAFPSGDQRVDKVLKAHRAAG